MSQDVDSAAGDAPAAARSPEEIERDIIETRARLVASVDELAQEANPVALIGRAQQAVRNFYVDPVTGEPNVGRIAKTAAGVAAFLLFRSVVRRGS
jgi:hypothetical protein